MLEIGSVAPDFALPDQDGREVQLGKLLEDGPLILYFYPADFTPLCTREACTFRDGFADLKAVGLQVVGISPQDSASHRRFRAQQRLPFPLLSDEDKGVISSYDVDGLLGIGVRRTTYLINRDGTIHDVVQADIMIGKHTEFLEKAVMLREAAGLRADWRYEDN
ncbi:MAG: peroxiredoxin [Woeseia sp.]|nr:peroxiredoxin [Woeseia sp.]MBT8095672.1 peroxiredoxin [Woeseia sp.]NNE60351.1 peroxiredoxin [Woeseia sp.]NNL54656.1 peroxiredoxin [Woeseia sp.]